MKCGNFLHDKTECHHAVGHGERVGMTKINFVLTWCIFVEAVFHRNAHGLERANGFFAQRTGNVGAGEVEESALVEQHWFVRAVRRSEIEVLNVGSNIKRVALVSCSTEVAAQHLARVAIKWSAIKFCNIAKHASFSAFRVCPWQYFECVRIWNCEYITFLYAAKAVNGRTIKAHSVIQRVFHFSRADGK